MDKELQKDWQKKSQPFDGEVLSLSDLVEISVLREGLQAVVSVLRSRFESSLLKGFEDWHEHDGYVTESNSVSWDQLLETIQNDQVLYQSQQGDTFVRRAFYPDSKEFLLRYYILDEDEDIPEYPGIWGDFDITSSAVVLDQLTDALPESLVKMIGRASAKNYFDVRYAG
jgi:hypothetical protein